MTNTRVKNLTETAIVIMLTITMIRMPRMHFICLLNGWYYEHIAFAVYNAAVPCLVLAVCRMAMMKEKLNLSAYEGVFGTMIVCQIISCFNALDRTKALYGESGRNEGFFMLLCYYLFFYAARMIISEKKRRLTADIFITIMALHALYGIAQFYSWPIGIPVFDHYFYAVSGVAGNPNFMASLMVMAVGAALGMFLYSEKIYQKVAYMLLLALFAFTLIFTKTMSGYVGAGVIVLIVFLNFIKQITNKKGKKYGAKLLLLLAAVGICGLFVVDRLAYGIVSAEIKGILNQLSGGIDIETVASGRFLIWKNIFNMLPQFIFSGVGIDGLQQPYYDRYGLLFGGFVDKAHNELIQVLITMGLSVFLCYIAIYALVVKDVLGKIKSGKNRSVDTAVFLAIIGYISQAMFNISVVDVAPYFWILLGLCAKPLIKTDSD